MMVIVSLNAYNNTLTTEQNMGNDAFDNNYDVSIAFCIKTWVKPESVSGIQTIFPKRDANN